MPNIIIQGYGMVGSHLHLCLQALGFNDVAIHDPFKGRVVSPDSETAERAEFLFYCVNEEDGIIKDGSLIERMVGGFVVLKTTIAIGETELLQSMYPAIHFVYMPEFLREAHAYDDMMEPDHLIYGAVDPDYSAVVNELFIGLKAPRFFVEPKTAEAFKLISNAYPLVKLIFFNQIYDLCQNREIDYDQIVAMLKKNKFNSGEYMKVVDKGGRGGGGKCLPKDTAILMNTIGLNRDLLKYIKVMNDWYLMTYPKEDK